MLPPQVDGAVRGALRPDAAVDGREEEQGQSAAKKKDGRRGAPPPAVEMVSPGSVADPVARRDYMPRPRSYQGVLSSTSW